MKKCIVILGAHRSGTSALMGALFRAGVSIGSEYIVDHYENAHILKYDTSLLEMLKSTWDDVFMLPDQWWMDKNLNAAKTDLLDILHTEFNSHLLWGIKEPRICRLLPLYLEAFQTLDVAPVFLIPLRDPFEVARSHKKRDGFPEEKALLVWMNHVLPAEHYSRGYLRCFCRFNDLIKAPEETLLRISRLLEVDYPKPMETALKDVVDFLKPGLKHHNIPIKTAVDSYPEPFRNLYDFLFSDTASLEEIENAHDVWDACYDQYDHLQRFFLAEKLRQKLIDLSDTQFQLLKLITETGENMIKNRQFESAIELFDRSLKATPKHRGFLNNLGVAYEYKGDLNRALEYYQKAMEISPDYTLAADNYNRVLQKIAERQP